MKLTDLEKIKKRFNLVGKSPALDRAIMMAAEVAPIALNVLITGENGTGKESFAKIAHYLSPLKHGNFIAVNCGAIPEGTIESELFGHEKGAFTGAGEQRKGYFEEANKGTIFLDEIGEMPLATQPRLLRVLENKEFLPVGSSKKKNSDARVIAATNVNLAQRIRKNQFREDLYYRLAQITIQVPPLRERGEDILLLFRKFTIDFSEKYATKLIQLTDEAKKMILTYSFPGNVRQLKNIAWQVAALEHENPIVDQIRLAHYLPKIEATPPILSPEHEASFSKRERELLYKTLFKLQEESSGLKKLLYQLLSSYEKGKELIANYPILFNNLMETPPKLANDKIQIPSLIEKKNNPTSIQALLKDDHQDFTSIADQEKNLIQRALDKWKNRKKVAAHLGIAERTLYRKIKEYGL